MATSSTWRPDPSEGVYVVARRIVVVAAASFTKIDFRTLPWFGQCPWLALGGHVATDGSRGVQRRVRVRFVPNAEDAATAAGADAIQYADEDPGAGGDKFVGVGAGEPYTRSYLPGVNRSYIWVRAPAAGGDIAIDLEVSYDIPTEAT